MNRKPLKADSRWQAKAFFREGGSHYLVVGMVSPLHRSALLPCHEYHKVTGTPSCEDGVACERKCTSSPAENSVDSEKFRMA